MSNLRAVVEAALSIFRTKRERAYARLRVSRGSATVGAWRLYARIVQCSMRHGRILMAGVFSTTTGRFDCRGNDWFAFATVR